MKHPRNGPRVILIVPVLVVASAAAAGCDIAMAELRQKETAEWRKTYDLPSDGRLEISNVNGKIEVQPGTGTSIEVVAEKSARAGSAQAAKDALERIEIQERTSPTHVRIETKIPRGSGGFFGGANQEVHYMVKVPPSLEVRLATVNGGIELSGLKGRVTAEATNGGVKAHDISGALDATTTNGGVEVDLADVADSGVKLASTNGGIRLRLPASAKATISARITNGGIDTDGIDVETSGQASRRRLEGRLNGGGPRIDLEGTNGGIRIAAR
jgi:putative adhesin